MILTDAIGGESKKGKKGCRQQAALFVVCFCTVIRPDEQIETLNQVQGKLL